MKTSLTRLATLAVVLASLTTLSAAEITGKVKLTGTPPAEKSQQVDALCGKARNGNATVTSRHYVVGADTGLGNVFVYLKEGVSKKYDAPATGPTLDQVGCEYQPYVLGLQTGQKLEVKNSDTFMHNVHVLSTKGNKESNVAQVRQGQVNALTFDKPEVLLKFKCDVHNTMFAYVGLVDHPFFAVTDKDGNFKISGVPAGKYTVAAYHLKAGEKTAEVTVGESDKKTQDFTLSVPAPQ